MKYYLILFVAFVQFSCFAQDENVHSYYWSGYEQYDAKIAAANCYVRESPSINSQLLDSLQMGKSIKVLNSTENHLQIKGINVPWVEIQYQNAAGKTLTGFLWQGFTAIGFQETKNQLYLTSIDKIQNERDSENYEVENFTISVKLLDKNNAIIAQKTIKKAIAGSAFFQGKSIGSLGLKGLEDIFRISFNGEACGIPTLYYYLGWNGKNFIELPEKYDVSDAGIFYHSEDFIFPKEKGGKPNLIIKQIEEGEYDEEADKDNSYILNITKHTETYKWDGEKAEFISETAPKKSEEKMKF